MRENCTYGSMSDILRAAGESRSDALAEVRAYPAGASRSTLLHNGADGHGEGEECVGGSGQGWDVDCGDKTPTSLRRQPLGV